MNILVLSYDYPDTKSSAYSFVQQFVEELANQGHSCQVIAPFPVLRKKRISKFVERKITSSNGGIIVYRPNYISIPFLRIGPFYPSLFLRRKAISKAFHKLVNKPDVVYGHFWNQAYEAYSFSKLNKIPLFVACGESNIAKMFDYKNIQKDFFDYVKGVFCASSKNLEECQKLGIAGSEKCIVAPNSINDTLFRLMDKRVCREELNIPHNLFVVAFVGWFIDRKGPNRVAQALSEINDANIGAFFIGEGTLEPNYNNILFKGRLAHDQIPQYLNAADVFVLPTLNEGCCNAIVEAMACGLPVVSSDMSFNWDVLNDKNSILINPNKVDEIKNAIIKLRDDDTLRENLRDGAIVTAKELTLSKRVNKIVNFINSKIT